MDTLSTFVAGARALIEQNWAWAVTVFGLRVSVLSVCAAEEATDPCGQTILLSLHPHYVNMIDALRRFKQLLCHMLESSMCFFFFFAAMRSQAPTE